jgi:hypothetical protein
MERRNFVKTGGIIAVSGLTALAGCSGADDNAPPPRKSNVIDDVSLGQNGSTLTIDPVPQEDQWVQSRRDLYEGENTTTDKNTTSEDTSNESASLSGLSPIGVASAAKGRGATGRGAGGFSSAPRTSNGRAWFFGGAYANSWYNDHDDEVEKYPTRVAQLGIAYIGSDEEFEEQDPGPGPVSWDETYDNPDPDTSIETDVADLQDGWYRVGANIVVDNRGSGNEGTTDLGWECIDIRVEDNGSGKEITERWKVSPRI